MLRYTAYGAKLTQHTHTHHAPRPHIQEIIKDSLTQTVVHLALYFS